MTTKQSTLPKLDMSTSTTGCCPVFQPKDWDDKIFVFQDKKFIKDHTVSFMHIPLNMSKAMNRLQQTASKAQAMTDEFVLLSDEVSPWHADHYYAVSKDVAGADNVSLSGEFYTKVYEGPYKDMQNWYKDLIKTIEDKGYELKKLYFYYTTCPKCAKEYNKNYVVGFAKISE